MKILRLVLLLGGLALLGWGIYDYTSDIPEIASQALSKIILGLTGFVAALLAKSRR